MSIYKEEHRDDRRFIDWLRGVIFRTTCDSYITIGTNKLQCNKRMGHSKRHTSHTAGKLSWGYGDNWLSK